MRVRIRQVYYEAEQRRRLDPGFLPYLNDQPPTPYFENAVIRRLFEASDHKLADYFGVFSWRFRDKHGVDGSEVLDSITGDSTPRSVYSFQETSDRGGQSSSKPNAFFDTFHPNLLPIGSAIVREVFDEDLSQIEAEPIYYNHWIATSGLFEGYCREMLVPAIELMEHDDAIGNLVWQDSRYGMFGPARPDLTHRMEADGCERAFGVPYYPHHSFVLERLPSIYFAVRNADVKYL